MSPNLVSLVRDLQRRKARRRRRLAVAEGVRLVEEALAAEVDFRGAIASHACLASPRGAQLVQELSDHAVPVEEVSDRAFEALAGTETPQGILAVIEPRRWELGDLVPSRRAPTVLLDGVQDPGNVGAVLRTVFALGGTGVALLPGTADPLNAKVMRAAMGASFRLPLAPTTVGELQGWMAQHEVRAWAATTAGSPVGRVDPPERLLVIVGNEGAGIHKETQALATEQVAVPLARGAESLNVAVALGIILHEVLRHA